MVWSYFRTTPLGELLTGTAHEAHPTDITAPLGVRFAGQTLLAIHVALDKAATVRVTFDREGKPRLSGIRNINQRTTAEFSETIRSEIAATRARWGVIVLATGWQAILGQRSARPEAGDGSGPFFRHKLMFDTPEVVVPKAQVDRVYTAVDHPVFDKSVVFSVRRRELETLVHDVRKCGLEIASIRIAVAAQLEVWLSRQGEGGLTRDLLVTDGLSALLVNLEQGDFVPPHGAVEAEQPRQSVQRPSAVEEDIVRFITANRGRSVAFLGPEDLCASVKKAAPDVEIVRPSEAEAHDTQHVCLAPSVRHELCCEAKDVRPALPRPWRRFVLGYAVLAALLAAVAGINAFYAIHVGYDCYRLERAAAQRAVENQADSAAIARSVGSFAEASALRLWVAANYHAQHFCYALLRGVPASAAIDRLQVEMKDGQITLTFIVLGDQDTQLATHRAIEKSIKELRYKIGGEDIPVGAAGLSRAVQYRMHIILPDAGEVAS